MITIRNAISQYKGNISTNWENEKYKWEAVQHFQKYWNIDAEDFGGMVEEAFRLAYNLLAGGMYYAYGMICLLSRQDPEKMRTLFRSLYDETLPLTHRYLQFRAVCGEVMEEAKVSAANPQKMINHYQDLRAICVYLSFKYPEKYFLYKYQMYADFMKLTDFQPTSIEKIPRSGNMKISAVCAKL